MMTTWFRKCTEQSTSNGNYSPVAKTWLKAAFSISTKAQLNPPHWQTAYHTEVSSGAEKTFQHISSNIRLVVCAVWSPLHLDKILHDGPRSSQEAKLIHTYISTCTSPWFLILEVTLSTMDSCFEASHWSTLITQKILVQAKKEC